MSELSKNLEEELINLHYALQGELDGTRAIEAIKKIVGQVEAEGGLPNDTTVVPLLDYFKVDESNHNKIETIVPDILKEIERLNKKPFSNRDVAYGIIIGMQTQYLLAGRGKRKSLARGYAKKYRAEYIQKHGKEPRALAVLNYLESAHKDEVGGYTAKSFSTTYSRWKNAWRKGKD